MCCESSLVVSAWICCASSRVGLSTKAPTKPRGGGFLSSCKHMPMPMQVHEPGYPPASCALPALNLPASLVLPGLSPPKPVFLNTRPEAGQSARPSPASPAVAHSLHPMWLPAPAVSHTSAPATAQQPCSCNAGYNRCKSCWLRAVGWAQAHRAPPTCSVLLV